MQGVGVAAGAAQRPITRLASARRGGRMIHVLLLACVAWAALLPGAAAWRQPADNGERVGPMDAMHRHHMHGYGQPDSEVPWSKEADALSEAMWNAQQKWLLGEGGQPAPPPLSPHGPPSFEDWEAMTRKHALGQGAWDDGQAEEVPWWVAPEQDVTGAGAAPSTPIAQPGEDPDAHVSGINRFPYHVRRVLAQSSYKTIWATSAKSITPAYTPSGVNVTSCTSCNGGSDVGAAPTSIPAHSCMFLFGIQTRTHAVHTSSPDRRRLATQVGPCCTLPCQRIGGMAVHVALNIILLLARVHVFHCTSMLPWPS